MPFLITSAQRVHQQIFFKDPKLGWASSHWTLGRCPAFDLGRRFPGTGTLTLKV